MTFLLAASAVAAIVVNLRLHRSELREREEAAFRAAIIEVVDECRAWVSAPPERQPNAARRLVRRRPQFDEVRNLMGSVTLEQPCLARLLARVAGVREWSDHQSEVVIHAGANPSLNPTEWSENWHLQVNQRQEVAGLLLGAASVRGHQELVAGLCKHPAVVPRPWKPTRAETEVWGGYQGGIPPYPTGDAYQPWSPSAQDAWAERVNEAVKQSMADGMRAARGW